ncbi:MAG: DUF4124 domain-containing protein [Gammaproteobacteria bacterium]
MRAFAVILLVATACVDAKQVYKWTDSEGNVHYGDRPNGAASEQIEVKSSDTAAPSASEAQRRERQNRLLQIYDEERREAREAAEKEKQNKEIAKRNCNVARDHLAQIQDASYLYRLDDKGERVAYTDEERTQATRKAELSVKSWCK